MANLSQQEWTSQLENDKNAVILDVRTEAEVNEGYIPNAIHLDIFEGQGFIDAIKKLDTDKSYFVYCRSGNRSGQACSLMNQLGFKNAFNLMGGFNEWKGPSTQ